MPQGEDKPISFSFPKKERLCSRLQLEQLMTLRQSVFSYPLKCYFQHIPFSEDHKVSQMAVSVPKKLEKTAVGRNRIKRWVREAYRLNKHLINNNIQSTKTVTNMLFVCVGKEKVSFVVIEKAVVEILHNISCRDGARPVSTDQ